MRVVKRGFTLVELSLAIAFIAVLSIIMTLIITNSISAYHRGITLNTVNTVGMDLVDNMREAVQNSAGDAVVGECNIMYPDGTLEWSNCVDTKGKSFVSVERYANIGGLGNVPMYGAFCAGNYSYIWNSGYFMSGEYDGAIMDQSLSQATLKYINANGDEDIKSGFKLLRVEDTHRAVCKVAAGVVNGEYLKDNLKLGSNDVNGNSFSGEFNLANCRMGDGSTLTEVCDAISSEPVELIGEGENGLALYDLAVATAADNGDTDIMFYAVSFILGTIQGGINIMSDNNYCATPEGDNQAVENFDYCAINKFNFAAQATGG